VVGDKIETYVVNKVECPECHVWFDTAQACGSHRFWKHQYRDQDGKPVIVLPQAPVGSDGKRKMTRGVAKVVRGETSLPMSGLFIVVSSDVSKGSGGDDV